MENSPNTDSLVQQNKKLKLFLIISVLLSVISISAIIIIFVFQLYPSEVPYMDTLPPFVVPETSEETNLDNGNTDIRDVSEYTDIVLSDYDGLEVYVSEGFDDAPYIVSGMVEYSLKSYMDSDENVDVKYELYGPNMRMEIINEKVLANEDQEALFDQAKVDIINKNIDANDFEVGYLDIFRNSLSDAAYKAVKEIDVVYPNTDYVFGVLFLGGYQDGPFAYPSLEENIGAPVTFRVYAIKGDNILSLSSFYMDTAELGVSKDDHDACTIADTDEYSPTYEGYFDTDCLSEVLQDEQYDEKIKGFTDDLLERFELAE
jgi:hypothetical protein